MDLNKKYESMGLTPPSSSTVEKAKIGGWLDDWRGSKPYLKKETERLRREAEKAKKQEERAKEEAQKRVTNYCVGCGESKTGHPVEMAKWRKCAGCKSGKIEQHLYCRWCGKAFIRKPKSCRVCCEECGKTHSR